MSSQADYINLVKTALDAGDNLVKAITREQAKHRDGCVMADSGPVAEALADAWKAYRAVRLADERIGNAA